MLIAAITKARRNRAIIDYKFKSSLVELSRCHAGLYQRDKHIQTFRRKTPSLSHAFKVGR